MTHQLPQITPGAEPFFYKAESSAACLCLHGFTAAPDEMRWFGHALAQQGISTYGPRHAGHGVDYHDLARMRWQDWYLGALDAYHLLRQQYAQVFVAGLSMGGLLSLMVAATVPVAGVVVMAAPFVVNDWKLEATHWLKFALPFSKQPDISDLPQRIRQEQARRGMPVVGRVRYDDWSTAAAAELHTVMLRAADCLPHVSAPVLTIYSQGDQTVPPKNAAFLQAHIGSKILEQHVLQKSDHVLTQDSECDTVFALAAAFVRRQAGL
ncbi:MAG: alpha/beta fold hydrolase [Chloroflexi bacterium]|nr:alpha/beta fold hydrolase [Chloroflexota bacterium]